MEPLAQAIRTTMPGTSSNPKHTLTTALGTATRRNVAEPMEPLAQPLGQNGPQMTGLTRPTATTLAASGVATTRVGDRTRDCYAMH